MNNFVKKKLYTELHITNCKNVGIIKIDTEDFEKVKMHSWYIKDTVKSKTQHHYVCAKINSRTVKLHRFLLGLHLFDNCNVVDHINRDAFDNRKSNLRLVSYSLNNHNSSINKLNKTGFRGVSIKHRNDGRSDSVHAQIRINKKSYLKQFSIKKYGLEKALSLANDFLVELRKAHNLTV
jgi:hypothetical protein